MSRGPPLKGTFTALNPRYAKIAIQEGGGKIPKTILKMKEEFPNLHLKETETKSNSKYKGVMSLIALEGAKDFITWQMLKNARQHNQDHIFPKSGNQIQWPTKYINSVLNMTWLSRDTNQVKGYSKPSTYLKQIISEKFAGNEEKFIEVLETHLISKEAFKHMLTDDFEAFLAKREETIISKIAQHLGFNNIKKGPPLISPDTPFTNKKVFWDTLKSCQGHIHWVDKYFTKPGLELISESSLDPGKIKEIKILMLVDKSDETFRKLFKDLRNELKNKGILFEVRVITDAKIKRDIHDRWILSENHTIQGHKGI